MTIVAQTEIHLLDCLLIPFFDYFEHFVRFCVHYLVIFMIAVIPKDL